MLNLPYMAKAGKKPQQIPARIREIRKSLGLTQAEFGKALGFSPTHLSSMENAA
jgi:transcriptional regulator with XRE-family HTH domain